MSTFIKNLAIGILILGAVGSIAMGNSYPILAYRGATYNYALLITCLLATCVFFAVLYGLGMIIEHLQAIRSYLLQIGNQLLKDNQEKEPDVSTKAYSPASPCTPDSKGAEKAIPAAIKPGYIKCPQCGCEQKENRSVCFTCGAQFIKPSDAQAGDQPEAPAVPQNQEIRLDASMQTCPKCHHELESFYTQCYHCGAPL